MRDLFFFENLWVSGGKGRFKIAVFIIRSLDLSHNN